eukprot:scaffold3132_cov119-Isochrysis_galbana.AAC.8
MSIVESILREVCETASGPILPRSEGAKGRFRKGDHDSAVLFLYRRRWVTPNSGVQIPDLSARPSESLGALPRGAATSDDAAPSGAHASSTADHARILAADYGGDMTDKSLLAVEDIPAVAAVGFGGLFFSGLI